MGRWAAALVMALLAAPLAWSQVPVPRDEPYPGVIRLRVDASDVTRRIFRVRETLPVRPGALTLLYPQWLPGNHAPRGPIEQLAGLRIRAGGRELPWTRDPEHVHAFRVRVPQGVDELDIEFEVATPQAPEQGRVVVTQRLLGLQWNQVVLYPAGHYARRIAVAAELRLPPDWRPATALAATAPPGEDGWTRFAPVSLEQLVDSPVFAGPHTGRVELTAGEGPPVRLNIFAEDPADIAVTQKQVEAYRAMVRETYAALGPPRYPRYDFLLALSDTFGGIGLEHHDSSENSHPPGHFRAWDEDVGNRDLLAHEFVHSWNGKYRRPARLWTPAYNHPMRDDLLWVYEGLTNWYGFVLTARAGLWSPEFARDAIAATAALHDRRRPGRDWRPLADTTYQPIIAARRPLAWPSWQRVEDYYSESVLLWLEVETRLRELTGEARGLDDFSRRFFAARPDEGRVSTYELRDVIAGLSRVAPFDWAALLRDRVEATGKPVGEALARTGWKLVYEAEPNAFVRDSEKARRVTDLTYSLGVTVNRDGLLTEVIWGSPAFEAGLTANTTLVAVDGRAWTADLLKDAVERAKDGSGVVELLVRNQDRYRTVRVEYRGGLVYPRLRRVEGTPDRLAALFAPRASRDPQNAP